MTQVTIHQAKTNLSRLIQKALQGEEVVIAKRDQPLVKLQVVLENKPQRRFGGLKHWQQKMSHPGKDDALDQEVADSFRRVYPHDPLAEKLPKGATWWW
jgi:antitoxin (DNA-binding transcriptional repressor) of toxin-antitoxin stability system